MSTTEEQPPVPGESSWSDRFQILALAVLTLVTVGLGALVITGFSSGDPTAAVDAGESDTSALVDESSEGAGATPRVVFIGDEWAQGAGASGPEKSFTALASAELGWTFDVDAVAGSGWTQDAPDVPNSQFVDRAARLNDGPNAPDVVVLSAQTPSGSPLKVVARAIEDTVNTVRERVPDSTIVVLLPVANNQAEVICPPKADGVICIDTFAEGWLIPGDRRDLMNLKVRAPNDAGHARLAEFLVEDLRADVPTE